MVNIMQNLTVVQADIATSDDIFQQLSSLDKKCVGAEGWSVDSFKSEVEKNNGIVLYIAEKDKIIALISAYTAVGEADITSVAVDPDYRRCGLALKLINSLETLIPDDTEEIFLEVREFNSAAIALYEKCGFKRISVRKNFYINPVENAVVMVKKLISNK